MTAKQKTIFRLTSPINRFLFTLTVAIFVYLITGEFYQELRFLLAYDLGILSYLSVLAVQMSKATAEDTFRLSRQQNPRVLSLYLLRCYFLAWG